MIIMLRKKLNLYNNAISSLIATILLVVVSVVVVIIILNFSKTFTNSSISKVSNINNSTLADVKMYLHGEESKNGRLFFKYNPSEKLKNRTISVYGYSLFDYPRIDFNTPIVLIEGLNTLDVGIIYETYNLVLYLDNDYEVFLSNIKNTNKYPNSCPDGYISVPGNALYNTNYPSTGGFCIMQYEAKVDENNDGIGDSNLDCKYAVGDAWQTQNSGGLINEGCEIDYGNRNLVSSAEGYPINYIASDYNVDYNSDYIDAKDLCSGLGSNYHLTTNEEWMTIARNIELQSENWSGGEVGSGKIKKGNIGYNETDVSYKNGTLEIVYTPKTVSDVTAKLILSNNSEIWDFSGNLNEWVDKKTQRQNLPQSNESPFAEYPEITDYSSLNYEDLFSLNSDWDNDQGLGEVYIYYDAENTDFRSWLRGGCYAAMTHAGVYLIDWQYSTAQQIYSTGFRCVYVP